MRFGLELRHWEMVERLVIEPLKAHGAEVWVFGSRARGSHHPFSDLDILYKLKEPLPFHVQALMKEALESSTLPIKVDIVAEEELASSYQNQVLRDRIAV